MADIIASGDGWSLDSDGLLTISVVGTMSDYISYISTPWYSYKDSVTSVYIENTVTSIGSCAFEQCINLTSVTIPDSVTSINDAAFNRTTNLTGITIPDSVTHIGEDAFNYSGLASIVIPDSIASIGEKAFGSCANLVSVTLSNNLTTISAYMFVGCSNLSGVVIPNGVTSIEQYAFSGCSSLTSISIPGSVQSLGMYTFFNCAELRNVTIRYGVPYIAFAMFRDCMRLMSISIPSSIREIKAYAFYNCQNLASVNIPYGVTSIKEYTFYKCSSIRTITIPSSVSVIEKYAFAYCVLIETINMYDSVSTIGNYAFFYTSDLKHVYYNGTIKQWNEISFGNTTSNPANFSDVTVHYKPSPASLTIVSLPTKTDYFPGETFSTAGMLVNATYDNGTIETITNYDIIPSGGLTTSDTSVTVSYTKSEKYYTVSATVPVTVSYTDGTKAYSIFIGTTALDKNKELLNPNKRQGGIPPGETLISCKYDMELNSAGSCAFVMPPTHPLISEITPMVTEVAIAEIDNIIWFGRVTDTKRDFWNRLEVHCEGAYAYFNDSIQPRETFYNLTPSEYLAKIVANHNAQVSANRRITIAFTKTDTRTISGEFRYESTISVLQKFLDDYGGYIYCLMSQTTGKPELYWIDSRNLATTQTVAFGENLVNLQKTVDFADICTAIIPLGADVEMEVPDLDENGNQLYEDSEGNQSTTQDETYSTPSTKIIEVPLNLGMTQDTSVEPDEDGIAPIRFIQTTTAADSLMIDGPNVNSYGRIVRSVTFNEAFDVAMLRQKATAWIASQALGGITIDVSAADLRFLDGTKGPFYLGLAVPVSSPPHSVSENLIITKIEGDIVKVTKKITLGRLSEKTLSDIAGRGENRYEVGTKIKKVSSKKKVSAKDSGILFIPA